MAVLLRVLSNLNGFGRLPFLWLRLCLWLNKISDRCQRSNIHAGTNLLAITRLSWTSTKSWRSLTLLHDVDGQSARKLRNWFYHMRNLPSCISRSLCIDVEHLPLVTETISISVQQPSSSSRGAGHLASCRDYAAAKVKQQIPRHTLKKSCLRHQASW